MDATYMVGDIVRVKECGFDSCLGLAGKIGEVICISPDADGYDLGIKFPGWRGGHSLHNKLSGDESSSGFFGWFREVELIESTEPFDVTKIKLSFDSLKGWVNDV